MARTRRIQKNLKKGVRRVIEKLFFTLTGRVVIGASAIIALISGTITFDRWVAKAEDLRKVDERVTLVDARLDEWKLEDDLAKTQQRLWRYQDRYGKECERADQVVRDECRALQEQRRRLEEKLKKYGPATP